MSKELADTIKAIACPGKGILAADESTSTIGKRFATIGLENSETNRKRYRSLIATTKNLGDFISGVILFEETLTQKAITGEKLVDVFTSQNIIPGIKVDKGLVSLNEKSGEQITQGLDGLRERLIEYKKQGARFAKWRNVYTIGDNTPSDYLVHLNAQALARYARLCQEQNIVPIVEPEVLMDGTHSIDECYVATRKALLSVFAELRLHKVALEYMILKPNMVISATSANVQASTNEVARQTVTVLKECVPAIVPSINFLSGGQTPQNATQNLAAMNKLPKLPWNLSFSYGRALQEECLSVWQGRDENLAKAQQALLAAAKANANAC